MEQAKGILFTDNVRSRIREGLGSIVQNDDDKDKVINTVEQAICVGIVAGASALTCKLIAKLTDKLVSRPQDKVSPPTTVAS